MKKIILILFIVIFLLPFSAAAIEEQKVTLKANIPEKYKQVENNDPILVNIELTSFKEGNSLTEIKIDYLVYNSKDELIFKVQETSNIRYRLNSFKYLNPPVKLNPGAYKLEVNARYDNSQVIVSDTFEIKETSNQQINSKYIDYKYVLIFLFLVVTIILFYFIRLNNIEKQIIARISEFDLKRKNLVKKRS